MAAVLEELQQRLQLHPSPDQPASPGRQRAQQWETEAQTAGSTRPVATVMQQHSTASRPSVAESIRRIERSITEHGTGDQQPTSVWLRRRRDSTVAHRRPSSTASEGANTIDELVTTAPHQVEMLTRHAEPIQGQQWPTLTRETLQQHFDSSAALQQTARWVTEIRGGGEQPGLSRERQGLSHLVDLGAGGRPLGAATQLPTRAQQSPTGPATAKLQPKQMAAGTEETTGIQDAPAPEGLQPLQQQLLMALTNMEARIASQEQLLAVQSQQLATQAQQLTSQERHLVAQLTSQEEECQRLRQDLQREAVRREVLEEILHQQTTQVLEEAQQQGTALDARVTQLEMHFQGPQEAVSAPAREMPSPVVSSTPRDSQESAPQSVQETASREWPSRATAGTTCSEISPELISAPEEISTPSPVKQVHFQQGPMIPDHQAPEQQESVPATPSPETTRTGKPNRSVDSVPTFAGKPGESLTTFFGKMDLAANLGNWEPSYHCYQMQYRLKGQAAQYIEGLPLEHVSTLEGITKALKERFLGKGVRKDAKENLRLVKRNHQESPQEYGLRVQQLARMAYPEDIETQNEEGVSAFLKGLGDSKTSETLVVAKYPDVSTAIDAVIEIERLRRSQTTPRIRQVAPDPPATDKKQKGAAAVQPATPAPQAKGKFWASEAEMKRYMERLVDQRLAEPRQLATQIPTQVPPLMSQGVMAPQGMGRGRGRPYVEHPSAERPCNLCGAHTHWQRNCPLRDQGESGPGPSRGRGQGQRSAGNGRGLDPRSGGQSSQRE